MPPHLTLGVTYTKRFRFRNTGAVNGGQVFTRDLLDLLCMAATTTSAYRLNVAVRLKAVELWGPAVASTTQLNNDMAFEFDSGASVAGASGAPDRRYEVIGLGQTRPGHLRLVPPVGSAASLWINLSAAANALWTWTVPAGSVVDVTLECVLNTDQGASAVIGTVAGATVGVVYYRSLDSSQNTAVWPPLGGLATI